ncbi:major facilitator superfamily transporter [Colletotrichum sojae]|uniref:Major facilitator superfamily transporter n=1 Tax=Colletotrichum sojae TaxID=2175907 RepID=A0A8H6MWL7_9PEZI|nr:major facilitator superfamily transporter [Colletotrichum sojae]
MHPRSEPDADGDTKAVVRHDATALSSDDEPTESTPLVSARRPAAGRSRTDSLLRAAQSIHVPKVHNPNLIVGIFCAIILVGSGAGGLWIIPATRMVEDIVCRSYYGALITDDIDESQCKEDAIQSKVATIFAVYGALQASIGAASAFPWGIIADRFGRKMVFSFSIIGMILNFLWFAAVCGFPQILPIKAVWFGPALLVFGGGNAVLSAIVFSMLADVTTSENRAKSFMRVHLASMIGNLCAPAISGWMMERTGPWPVVWLAFGLFSTLIFTIHLVPETKPVDQVPSTLTPTANEPEETSIKNSIRHVFLRLKESLTLLESPSVVVLLVALLGYYPVIMSTAQFMSIFASRRFHVSLSQTGYLSALYGLGVLLAVIFFLPAFSRLLASPTAPKQFRFPDDHQRDLFMARVSSVAFLIGSLVMSASPTVGSFIFGLAILSLGTGWGSYVKSISTVFVDAAHRTRLYSIMSLVEMVGQTYAEPMLAGLFSLGMRMGGLWIGLPYLGVAGFCALALMLLLIVRLPDQESKRTAEEGGADVQAQH